MFKIKSIYLFVFCLLTTLTVNGETEGVQKTKFTVQSKMSTLWTATTLNWIFADVLGIYQTSNEDHEEFAQDKNTQLMMLAGGAIAIQVPISMIFLSKVLPYKANRVTNMIAPAVCAAMIWGGGTYDEPSYIACAAFETIWLTAITVYAIKWRNPEIAQKWKKKNNVSFNLNYDKKGGNLRYTHKFGG